MAAAERAASGRTTAHAPVTRAPNSAIRERPVAARSRKTPDSMSWAPAVEPTMAPATMVSSIDDVHGVLEARGAAGRTVLAGIAGVLDGA